MYRMDVFNGAKISNKYNFSIKQDWANDLSPITVSFSNGDRYIIDLDNPESVDEFILSTNAEQLTPELIKSLNGIVIFSDKAMYHFEEVGALQGLQLFRESFGANRLVAYNPEKFYKEGDFLKFHGSNLGDTVTLEDMPINLSTCRKMFSETGKCKDLILKWPANKIEDMTGMFFQNTTIQNLDLSELATNHVKHMTCMFQDCRALDNVSVENFSTSNVTTMACMFQGCIHLSSIKCGDWDVGKVTCMDSMLQDCTNLKSLNLNKWNTHRLMTADLMFKGCSNLSAFHAEGWDLSNLITLSDMFAGCTRLLSTPSKFGGYYMLSSDEFESEHFNFWKRMFPIQWMIMYQK